MAWVLVCPTMRMFQGKAAAFQCNTVPFTLNTTTIQGNTTNSIQTVVFWIITRYRLVRKHQIMRFSTSSWLVFNSIQLRKKYSAISAKCYSHFHVPSHNFKTNPWYLFPGACYVSDFFIFTDSISRTWRPKVVAECISLQLSGWEVQRSATVTEAWRDFLSFQPKLN
jgi:hypothetical protein